jgi:hypothetical protein
MLALSRLFRTDYSVFSEEGTAGLPDAGKSFSTRALHWRQRLTTASRADPQFLQNFGFRLSFLLAGRSRSPQPICLLANAPMNSTRYYSLLRSLYLTKN